MRQHWHAYCQAAIEDRKPCTEHCDHCKAYYAPLINDNFVEYKKRMTEQEPEYTDGVLEEFLKKRALLEPKTPEQIIDSRFSTPDDQLKKMIVGFMTEYNGQQMAICDMNLKRASHEIITLKAELMERQRTKFTELLEAIKDRDTFALGLMAFMAANSVEPAFFNLQWEIMQPHGQYMSIVTAEDILRFYKEYMAGKRYEPK